MLSSNLLTTIRLRPLLLLC